MGGGGSAKVIVRNGRFWHIWSACSSHGPKLHRSFIKVLQYVLKFSPTLVDNSKRISKLLPVAKKCLWIGHTFLCVPYPSAMYQCGSVTEDTMHAKRGSNGLPLNKNTNSAQPPFSKPFPGKSPSIALHGIQNGVRLYQITPIQHNDIAIQNNSKNTKKTEHNTALNVTTSHNEAQRKTRTRQNAVPCNTTKRNAAQCNRTQRNTNIILQSRTNNRKYNTTHSTVINRKMNSSSSSVEPMEPPYSTALVGTFTAALWPQSSRRRPPATAQSPGHEPRSARERQSTAGRRILSPGSKCILAPLCATPD